LCAAEVDLTTWRGTTGDNLFFTDTNADGWQAIDFQLTFKGPIPSDLAYLMASGSVLPEVFNQGEDEVLHLFYDEFQRHTTAYTADVYPFEKFKAEYTMMQHVIYMYFVAMGAVIWQSSEADGKIDPSQPDVAVGPVGASPEIGSGSVKVSDLTPEDMRKRMWWKKAMTNFKYFAMGEGGMALLKTLPDNAKSEIVD
jgi:hypothetical protein